MAENATNQNASQVEGNQTNNQQTTVETSAETEKKYTEDEMNGI